MKDIRALYLEFFKSNGHKVYDSMPLVPDDASLLFTNAGMVQFKDIFTGKIPIPSPNIATSSQLCIRAGGKHNDLENVGYTARHHTLFEMLGNFSFGAYFKKEAIAYAWEFVTEILGFDKSLLYVTIHESDDEAYELWQEHIESSRIKRMGDKDNFWQMGDTGPCGPCSEIYVDQGAEFFNGEEDYFGGEGDRFLEIWNLVFMQYERSADGSLTPLPKPSIDTGMGLERVIALKEGEINNFDSSLFAPIMQCIKELTSKSYYRDSVLLKNTMGFAKDIIDSCKKDIASFRVIADHARAVAFLLAQGVNFDKEGRGYVLRRILRRAVRHGYLLGLRKAFLYEVVGVVCDSMGGHYSYLIERKNALQEQCKAEEERFFETIESGMALFNAELEKLRGYSVLSDKSANLRSPTAALTSSKLLVGSLGNADFSSQSLECQDSHKVDSNKTKEAMHFSGEIAFKLYDTYGFPLDLTQDMLRELGLGVDMQGFEKCMQEQKERSKAHWKGSGDSVKDGDFNALLSEFGENEFVGYESISTESKILALLDSNFKRVESLQAGQEGWMMLESTPFYPESGGPIGDKGVLFNLEHSACNNSSLGNHSGDFVDFRGAADSMSSSPLKSTKSPTSNTANTRIVDSSKVDSGSPQNIIAKVLDTQKYFGLNLSKVVATSMLKTGDLVKAQVDSSRFEIIKHHSATHLLHYALRQILGSHIAQAGSLVEANRLRFDFSHPKALSVNELEQIEALVNEKIAESSPQMCETMGIDQAKAKGAMALFGEKYGESVRVITLGDSIELCGGIHIHNTAEIGSFYIVRESSVSSGVRRIEAVCGKAAYHYGKAALESIKTLKEQLKAQDVLQGVVKLQNALKEARDNANKAKQSVKSLDYEEINGVKLIVLKLDSVETKEAKDIIDRAKNENEKVAILLVTESGGKVSLTAGVKGVSSLKAGAWVKQVAQILGGNGGGRDDFATAGGKVTESNKVQEALDLAKQIAREKLG
ncbi:alanyl-tRNA synthetase [Helicobacter cinaedi PAGU611]|uniref:alanine--tRNA ligase n=1 Tax=Helicobacter cinaedi TaxID=213 RepID=UPI00025D3443|nr:alanine--tRNA ligase [Helicobacter cinaedi]BAM12900.1 alanyl-tRNA synthetase [Helicobacter cinaedi PAGU611]BBB20773.1 alanyl-tRNA synthetase [Helicobacter cinaedi]